MRTLSVACFGKLPFHREFLRLGLHTAAAAWVVHWVDEAHARLSQAGQAPAASRLARFAVALADRVVAGVARESSDGLRRHPVTFFVEDDLGAGPDDWHLAPVAFEAAWDHLTALASRSFDDLASLNAELEAGAPAPDWRAAQRIHQETLEAALASPWTSLAGREGDVARHLAANFLAVAEAQRAAGSAAEGVSVAVPLPSDLPLMTRSAAVWLELLRLGAGAPVRPAIVLREGPPCLVAFYRPPEGPDLAAVLGSFDMAPIDDLSDVWQALPDAASARGRAIDALTGAPARCLGELRDLVRQVVVG